eukprot:750712-Pelagomonas_calceolata.AAC.3
MQCLTTSAGASLPQRLKLVILDLALTRLCFVENNLHLYVIAAYAMQYSPHVESMLAWPFTWGMEPRLICVSLTGWGLLTSYGNQPEFQEHQRLFVLLLHAPHAGTCPV